MAKKKQAKAKGQPKKKAVKKSAAKAAVRATTKRPARAAKRSAAPKAAPAKSKARAAGYQWLNTYLNVRNVQAAIDFYQNAFGFSLKAAMPGPDGAIMHAEMMHNDSTLMLGPENPERGSLAPQGPSPVTIYAYVEDVDGAATRAGNLGGKVMQAPADMFWGDRCAIIIDPEGHSWMLATHVRDVPPEEMHP